VKPSTPRWSRPVDPAAPTPARRDRPGFDFAETIRIDARRDRVGQPGRHRRLVAAPPTPTTTASNASTPATASPSGPDSASGRRSPELQGRGSVRSPASDSGTSVTWEAPRMRYRLGRVPFTISEGVTWRVAPNGPDRCRLSAHVWARFPAGPVGRTLRLVFTRPPRRHRQRPPPRPHRTRIPRPPPVRDTIEDRSTRNLTVGKERACFNSQHAHGSPAADLLPTDWARHPQETQLVGQDPCRAVWVCLVNGVSGGFH